MQSIYHLYTVYIFSLCEKITTITFNVKGPSQGGVDIILILFTLQERNVYL